MRKVLTASLAPVLGTLLLLATFGASAAGPAQYTLTLRNHVFAPAQLVVPANTKFRLVVINEDATPEEFESHELNREKIVTGKGRIVVFLGPLKPGTYPYFGEFNMATAKGTIVAR